MLFEPLPLEGACLVRCQRTTDDRGSFGRIICTTEFAAHGLNGAFVQSSISHNNRRGTVRGLHFQWPPSRESKLVRCTRGAIHDVLLDLRPGSATFMQHVAVTLDEKGADAVYIPSGIGHGFQTLTDDALVQYHMTDVFRADLADGFRWNDPVFSISLPLEVAVISERDATYPAFDTTAYVGEFRRRQQRGAAP